MVGAVKPLDVPKRALHLTDTLIIDGLKAATVKQVIEALFPNASKRQALLAEAANSDGVPVLGKRVRDEEIYKVGSFLGFGNIDPQGHAEVAEQVVHNPEQLTSNEFVSTMMDEFASFVRLMRDNKDRPGVVEKCKDAARRIAPIIVRALALREKADYAGSKTPLFFTYNPFGNVDAMHLLLSSAYEALMVSDTTQGNYNLGDDLMNDLIALQDKLNLPKGIHTLLCAEARGDSASNAMHENPLFYGLALDACVGDRPSPVAARALGSLGPSAAPLIQEALTGVRQKQREYQLDHLENIVGTSALYNARSARRSATAPNGRHYEYPLHPTLLVAVAAERPGSFFTVFIERLQASGVPSAIQDEFITAFENKEYRTKEQREEDEKPFPYLEQTELDESLLASDALTEGWHKVIQVINDMREEVQTPLGILYEVEAELVSSLYRSKTPRVEDETARQLQSYFASLRYVNEEDPDQTRTPRAAAMTLARSPEGVDMLTDILLDLEAPRDAREIAAHALCSVELAALDEATLELLTNTLTFIVSGSYDGLSEYTTTKFFREKIPLERRGELYDEMARVQEENERKFSSNIGTDGPLFYSAQALGRLIEKGLESEAETLLLAMLRQEIRKIYTPLEPEAPIEPVDENSPSGSDVTPQAPQHDFDDDGDFEFLSRSPFLDNSPAAHRAEALVYGVIDFELRKQLCDLVADNNLEPDKRAMVLYHMNLRMQRLKNALQQDEPLSDSLIASFVDLASVSGAIMTGPRVDGDEILYEQATNVFAETGANRYLSKPKMSKPNKATALIDELENGMPLRLDALLILLKDKKALRMLGGENELLKASVSKALMRAIYIHPDFPSQDQYAALIEGVRAFEDKLNSDILSVLLARIMREQK